MTTQCKIKGNVIFYFKKFNMNLLFCTFIGDENNLPTSFSGILEILTGGGSKTVKSRQERGV